MTHPSLLWKPLLAKNLRLRVRRPEERERLDANSKSYVWALHPAQDFKISKQSESRWLHPRSIITQTGYASTWILLLTLNNNLLVGPLNQSIAQSQANSESSAGWKFRHIARNNGILTDPLLGLFCSIGRLKSRVILHPLFAGDTADSQKQVLGWWDHWWSNVWYFEGL